MKKGDISNMPTPIVALDLNIFVKEVYLGIFGKVKRIEYSTQDLGKLSKSFMKGSAKVVLLTTLDKKICEKVEEDLDANGIFFSEVVQTDSIKNWVNMNHAIFFTEDDSMLAIIGPKYSKRWSWLAWI